MPHAALALCTEPGCGNLVPRGKCDEHRAEQRRQADRRRPSGSARGYTKQWAVFSKEYLRRHPLCECDECAALPIWKRPAATDVDHRDGSGRNGPRAYDESNLVALSHAHHSAKTVRHDGGFGRPKKA